MELSLFKGFKKLGEFGSILEAKEEAKKFGQGVYNLIEKSGKYRCTWIQD